MTSTPPVRPSHPGDTNGGTPIDGSLPNAPVSGGFSGTDYLYSATGTVKSSFTGFIWHVFNGAKMVVRTIACALFYPFLSHYEAEISPEKLKNILACIKDAEKDYSTKFSALETNVRIAVRNKGDTSFAKKIIEAFAEAEKEKFGKIAEQVIKVQDIDMSAITLTLGSYVLSRIQNGQTTITDFYHALNFYRMQEMNPKQQLVILEYQVQRCEILRGEIPHTQKLLEFFANINQEAFKEVAACLAEVSEEVKVRDGKSLEKVAKEWVEDGGRFEAAKMREALDLKAIKAFVAGLKEKDPYDQAYNLYEFFIRREAKGDQEVSEERRDFVAKTLLEKLHTTSPELMKALCLQMIKVDEENKSITGLFSAAEKDTLWKQPEFSPEKYVLAWAKKEKKFDRNVMINAFLRIEQNVLLKGIVDGNKTPSGRLDLLNRGLKRLPRAQLGTFLTVFAKAPCNDELGAKVIEELVQLDKLEAAKPGAVRLIPDLDEKNTDALKAIVAVAEDAIKKGDLSLIFRGRLCTAVSYTQIEQLKAEPDEEMGFNDRLTSFLKWLCKGMRSFLTL